MESRVTVFYCTVFVVLVLSVASHAPKGPIWPRPKMCPFGSAGTCMGYTGVQCPWGSYCRMYPGSTGGTCCWIQPMYDVCRGRPSKGTCGGYVGARCSYGYKCIYPPGSTLGRCCRKFY